MALLGLLVVVSSLACTARRPAAGDEVAAELRILHSHYLSGVEAGANGEGNLDAAGYVAQRAGRNMDRFILVDFVTFGRLDEWDPVVTHQKTGAFITKGGATVLPGR